MIQKLKDLEKRGLIKLREHNDLPLLIANYTPKVQYDRLWDEDQILKKCRGLIVDKDGKIVARSMPKFFNYQEHQEFNSLPDIPTRMGCEVTLKYDGSLGIIYWYEGKWRVATRGSFHSEQANKAREMLTEYDTDQLKRGYTYLVEIIYPNNMIVVQYDKEELVLITKIRNQDGKEPLKVKSNIFHVVESYPFTNIDSTLQIFGDVSGQEMEGFVFHYGNGLRIKVKLDDYVRLHRLITGLTARKIWRLLKDGEDVKELFKEAPDEIYGWIIEKNNKLVEKYTIKKRFAKSWFGVIKNKLDNEHTRKEFALKIKDDPFINEFNLKGAMFLLLDGKSIDDYIWKLIKPEHETY